MLMTEVCLAGFKKKVVQKHIVAFAEVYEGRNEILAYDPPEFQNYGFVC